MTRHKKVIPNVIVKEKSPKKAGSWRWMIVISYGIANVRKSHVYYLKKIPIPYRYFDFTDSDKKRDNRKRKKTSTHGV